MSGTYTYRDEAVAAALLDSEPGDVVVVHEVFCEMRADDDSTRCTCRPEQIEVPEVSA